MVKESLSRREREVVALLMQGARVKTIAARLSKKCPEMGEVSSAEHTVRCRLRFRPGRRRPLRRADQPYQRQGGRWTRLGESRFVKALRCVPKASG